jgi:hypothetical protein
MKKIKLALLASLTFGFINAQDINDAMRYSINQPTGTARFQALSGAFGALGGDLSAISSNPAGSVIFANSQAGITLGNYNVKNESNYFGGKTSENDSSFDINQAGGVFVFANEDNRSKWKKFALAINYENSRNLDNTISAAGTNPTNSVGNYFLSYANGIPLNIIDESQFNYGQLFYNEQQAYLGYQTFVINPSANNNVDNQYVSNVAPGGNYAQKYVMGSTGYNGKLTFNGSAQYNDTFSIGLSLNSHFIDYRQTSSFLENNNNPTSTESRVNRIRFDNQLFTYGNGFSFQIGSIFKASKDLRLGLVYDSPTWLRLNDEVNQGISTTRSNSSGETPTSNFNSNLTVVLEPYRLQTPGKWTGSAAYIFGKKALLSFDYSIKDYSNVRYIPKVDFDATNATINNLLSTSNEFRLGAEYKIERVSLRGGYRFEESPYKDKTFIGDLQGVSGGIGYNFGIYKLDLSYAYSKRDFNQQFYSQGFTESARINATNNNVSVTLLMEL